MNNSIGKFEQAIAAFDRYNEGDPNHEEFEGKKFPKEILYAQRMTERLTHFEPSASEAVKLAARCQHIGRWEILRSSYPMDKKGYLQWRNAERIHHAKIAEQILIECGYEAETIERVKTLVLKKELATNAQTQLLEDVVCLVFIEHYLDEFADKHETGKVIDIIQKTIKKMTPKAIAAVDHLQVSDKTKSLLKLATSTTQLFGFEEIFMKDDIRCIPMVVRFKLDKCGIKLKLSQWNSFTIAERNRLARYEATSQAQLLSYRKLVELMVLDRAGETATEMPIEPNPAWAQVAEIHEALLNKVKEFGWTISLDQWKSLSDLQRFALTKLSRPSHENKNFEAAMKEFGLAK